MNESKKFEQISTSAVGSLARDPYVIVMGSLRAIFFFLFEKAGHLLIDYFRKI